MQLHTSHMIHSSAQWSRVPCPCIFYFVELMKLDENYEKTRSHGSYKIKAKGVFCDICINSTEKRIPLWAVLTLETFWTKTDVRSRDVVTSSPIVARISCAIVWSWFRTGCMVVIASLSGNFWAGAQVVSSGQGSGVLSSGQGVQGC